ncbi:AMP-binding protein [Yinghuangia sp. ASG 101]|uniref:class I adenylate-forming enzyme family protein n=1 Tax=Yinghuangia sp. ASG 101 TaxID=2896848 RepID=UPI001E621C61|nr:AMP-binding protein [Yinghuangia sp. ASG 101]UGQ09232.1 AMP-binding protein [Yinghuangia sp. ASG 101]
MSAPIYDAATLWELVERRAAASPDVPMLLDPDDRRVTFAEFKAWAERVAAGYHALGIGAGTRVSWQLPTRIESIVAATALARLGAVQNPIIPFYRAKEVGFCLRQTRAEFFLTPGVWKGFDFAAMGEALGKELPDGLTVLVAYDGLPEGDPAALPSALADGEEVRWLYYTSGTTSDPKGVQHTDGTLIAGGIGLARALDMAEGDIGSIAFPYAHIAGPDYVNTLLVTGFPAVVVETFDPASVIPVYARLGVTMVGGSTAFYLAFLGEQRKRPGTRIIPTLRIVSGGGAPKPPELFREVADEMRAVLCHGYGMTECPMIAQGGPGDSEDQLTHSEGRPVHGIEVRIVRADGEEAGPDEEGEVRLRGPMVFKGYTDPALNDEAFDADGFFRTGDLGKVRADGHLALTGRLKDVIIRKGENISAREIEDLLFAHPKVADVAVVGLDDRERGERVCAVVERQPGEADLEFAEMSGYLADAGLMRQKIPEQLEIVDALPRNETLRKVLKFRIRDEFNGRPWSPRR